MSTEDALHVYNRSLLLLQELTQVVTTARTQFGFHKLMRLNKLEIPESWPPGMSRLILIGHLQGAAIEIWRCFDDRRNDAGIPKFLVSFEAFLEILDQMDRDNVNSLVSKIDPSPIPLGPPEQSEEGVALGRPDLWSVRENSIRLRSQVARDRKRLRSLSERYNVIKTFRNKSVAHLDEEVVLNPDGTAHLRRFRYNEFDELGLHLERILRLYRKALTGSQFYIALNSVRGFLAGELQVAWKRHNGEWMLPGGFDPKAHEGPHWNSRHWLPDLEADEDRESRGALLELPNSPSESKFY